ncbi:MAG: response regulator [Reichenbachiella sp.]
MKRVFVIDDDPVLQKIMHRMIKNYDSSVEIFSFMDGREAIKKMISKVKMPDLIFLDINMPEMNAWQFIDAYLEESFLKIPIYILSSSIDRRDIDRANDIELVRKYLIKPMKKQDLHEICNSELGIES